jgi:RNA polymerase sigma-70 factor (ECF subfamily)
VNWDGLFEANADDLIRVCWRILGRRVDVEDCVQETFVQAFQIQQREAVRNWPGLLRRIAVMTALATLRKRKVRPNTTLSQCEYDPPASGEMPDERAVRQELEARLRREVSALPDQEAAVFCLRYFESFSVTETASTLGISRGAVCAASHRARKHLEQRMSDVLPTTLPE